MNRPDMAIHGTTVERTRLTKNLQAADRLRSARELFEKDDKLLTKAQCSERDSLCDELRELQIEILYDVLDRSMDFISNEWRVRIIDGNRRRLREHLVHFHGSTPIEWGCTASEWLGKHQ